MWLSSVSLLTASILQRRSSCSPLNAAEMQMKTFEATVSVDNRPDEPMRGEGQTGFINSTNIYCGGLNSFLLHVKNHAESSPPEDLSVIREGTSVKAAPKATERLSSVPNCNEPTVSERFILLRKCQSWFLVSCVHSFCI